MDGLNASSAANISEYQPEEAMNYYDFYNQSAYGGFYKDNKQDPNSIWMRFLDFFSGEGKTQRENYNTYLDNLKQRNELKATQSANVYKETLENSAYQRAFKDIEKAGFNPYLLMSGGSVSPASSSGSAYKASYNDRKSLDIAKQNDNGRSLALILLATARILASGSNQPNILKVVAPHK